MADLPKVRVTLHPCSTTPLVPLKVPPRDALGLWLTTPQPAVPSAHPSAQNLDLRLYRRVQARGPSPKTS